MNKPLITVLLCTYNDAQYIRAAMESILDQTFKNFEFLIIDDGSTDDTAAIIHSFSDERIIYLKNAENKGLEFSKNRGIEAAKGKYIAYMDGDDKSKPTRLQEQFSLLEANPGIGFCSTNAAYFGSKTGTYAPPSTDLEIRLIALFGTPLLHPACMIRRDILLGNQIRYRMDFPAAEDYPFMVDLLTKTRAGNLPKPLHLYQVHKGSISADKNKIQQESKERGGHYAFEKLLGIEVTAAEKSSLKTLLYHQRKGEISVPIQPIFDRIEIKKSDSETAAEFKRFFIEKGGKCLIRYEKRKKSGIFGLFKEILSERFKV